MDNVVLKIVAKAYGLTVSDILSKTKKGKQPEALRMVTLFLKNLKYPMKAIAYSVNRDRTTVHYNLKKIAFEIATYKPVQQKKEQIQMSLTTYLKDTKTNLENWLKNNPHQDQAVREEKLARLEDVNETYEYIINL